MIEPKLGWCERLLFDVNHVSRFDRFQSFQRSWQERAKARVAVPFRRKNQNGNFQIRDVLLIRNVAVNYDQHIVDFRGGFEEFAIFQTSKPGILHRGNVQANKIALEMVGYTLVKQQLHFRAAFLSRVPGCR